MTTRDTSGPQAKGYPAVPDAQDDALSHRSADAVPRISVSTLMQGAREVILDHNDQHYRLRITASGKLILTK